MESSTHGRARRAAGHRREAGRGGALGSSRLLATFGDERLVEQARLGNRAAFAVMYDRHHRAILSFCRHMLGELEEAEDALQHTFLAAWGDLQRHDREIKLKPWLYAIARNRCLSALRARREQATDDVHVSTAGLTDEVQHRADLREILADLRELPEDQRAALVLSELGDLSHEEVAAVIGCRRAKVKSLVFQARTGLAERRAARETPCQEFREQLATLRGGSLRRGPLRRHLRSCPGCRAYRDEVRRQRAAMAALLPVIPSAGLKASVLGASSAASTAAAGATAAGSVAAGATAAGSGAAAGGALAGAAAKLGAAKLATIAVAAGGAATVGGVAVEQAVETERPPVQRSAPASPAVGRDALLPAAPTRPMAGPGDRARARERRAGRRAAAATGVPRVELGRERGLRRSSAARGKKSPAAKAPAQGPAGKVPKSKPTPPASRMPAAPPEPKPTPKLRLRAPKREPRTAKPVRGREPPSRPPVELVPVE